MSTYNFVYAKLAAEEAANQILVHSIKELRDLAREMGQASGVPDELREKYEQLVESQL